MAVKRFTLSDNELSALRYAVNQTMYKVEASIDAQQVYNEMLPSSSRSELIEALEELLLDLECVYDTLFEGGED